jgi:hypothetical protein
MCNRMSWSDFQRAWARLSRLMQLTVLVNHDGDKREASHQLVIYLTSTMGQVPVRSEVAEVFQITRLITKDSSGAAVRR